MSRWYSHVLRKNMDNIRICVDINSTEELIMHELRVKMLNVKTCQKLNKIIDTGAYFSSLIAKATSHNVKCVTYKWLASLHQAISV